MAFFDSQQQESSGIPQVEQFTGVGIKVSFTVWLLDHRKSFDHDTALTYDVF